MPELFIKDYLFTPGPTPVPERVAQAMAAPVILHRGPAFAAILAEIARELRALFATSGTPLVLSGSGTAGMEAAVTSFLAPGDEAIVARAGKFGARFAALCESRGVVARAVEAPFGEAISPAAVGEALARYPAARAVLFQATETSTGVSHPTREIAEEVRRRGDALVIVDGITAVGVYPLPMDEWGLDVVISASQKALMLPPGLALVAASTRAWQRADEVQGGYYLSLRRERAAQEKHQTAFTPAISLLYGLREALRMLGEEGLPKAYARHARLAAAARAGLSALGFSLFAKGPPAPAVTAAAPPAGVDAGALLARLREAYGVTLNGGQDELKGRIIRLGHVGYAGPFDVTTALAALELGLADLSGEAPRGRGVGAALAALRAPG
jgi:aspartate aminotransferase-like enzyme